MRHPAVSLRESAHYYSNRVSPISEEVLRLLVIEVRLHAHSMSAKLSWTRATTTSIAVCVRRHHANIPGLVCAVLSPQTRRQKPTLRCAQLFSGPSDMYYLMLDSRGRLVLQAWNDVSG